MTTAQWKDSGAYLNFRKYQIFYVDSGSFDKPCLLLLHGFPTASWDWWKIWQMLKQDYRLIAFDFLGFGFSDKPLDIRYSIHLQTDATEQVLHDLGIKDFHVMAHDYGVSVVQELLARQLDHNSTALQSICFLNGGVFAEMHRPLLIQQLMLSPMGRYLPVFLGKGSLKRSFDKIFGPDTQASDEELSSFWSLLSYNNGKWAFPHLIKYIWDRREHRNRWCLPLIHPSIPIRFINGNIDPISGKHVTERYLELYPKADVVDLPNIGHYPNTEAPQEVVKHFKDFQENIR